MTDIIEIAEHMINIVEDYAEIMGVSVVIDNEIQSDQIVFTVYLKKEND